MRMHFIGTGCHCFLFPNPFVTHLVHQWSPIRCGRPIPGFHVPLKHRFKSSTIVWLINLPMKMLSVTFPSEKKKRNNLQLNWEDFPKSQLHSIIAPQHTVLLVSSWLSCSTRWAACIEHLLCAKLTSVVQLQGLKVSMSLSHNENSG